MTADKKKTTNRMIMTSHNNLTKCSTLLVSLVAILYLANQLAYAQAVANPAVSQDENVSTAKPSQTDLFRGNQSSETTTAIIFQQRQQQAQITELSSGTSDSSSAAILPKEDEANKKLEDKQAQQTGANVAEQDSSPSASLAARQLQAPARSAPILRPSIEEVASELSKKYLNLERHKQQQSSTSLASVPTEPQTSPVVSPSGQAAEQEIAWSSSVSASRRAENSSEAIEKTIVGEIAREGQYMTIDSAISIASSARQTTTTHINNSSQAKRQTSSRRKKQQVAHFQQQSASNVLNEDTELVQCQTYLQQHSTAYQALLNSESTSGKLAYSASQLLPCSCQQSSWHFAASSITSGGELPRSTLDQLQVDDQSERVWLNCDNIQLIGSQLFTPTTSSSGAHTGTNFTGGPTRRDHDDHEQNHEVTKFSQRDAGLQVLFSQKFHYLQLAHLKSIDLSQNRIRQIKMDAFHGLESTLEFLNLAHNLLGDARAMSSSNVDQEQQQHHQSQGQSVFISDELSRLKKLKWLSLRDNQIDQLGANVFSRPLQSSSSSVVSSAPSNQLHRSGREEHDRSPLVYLDLSDNLLKTVPSEALQRLDSLQVLRLNDNRILHLDQVSKFPRSLRYLDLSGNLINSIQHCDLIDLPHLFELNLSHNHLRQLDQTAFMSASVVSSPSGGAMVHQQEIGDAQQLDPTSGQKLTRRRREVEGAQDLETDESSLSHDDLEADESIFSAITDHLKGTPNASQQQVLNDALQMDQPGRPPVSQFNATLRLNLSHNLLENVPGDSLLKFSHLQVLDLAHNRIRRLDSNYLCSIYNLVENLRHLDLSGNLLSLSANEPSVNQQHHHHHLNKLFGCLQRIQRLLLSTNRLTSNRSPKQAQLTAWNELDEFSVKHQDEVEFIQDDSNSRHNGQDLDLDEAADESQSSGASTSFNGPARLVIKFGENFGNKQLNTLDLSDNQLRLFPLIELVSTNNNQLQHEAIVSNKQLESNLNNSAANQARLNQWMSARVHLEVLNLDYNYLERIEAHELEHLFNLQELHLNFNKLTSLPARTMRRFTSLVQLSLAGNRIGSLEPMHDLFERSLRSLRRLNLANNRLMGWPELSRSSSSLFTSTSSASSQQQAIAPELSQGRNFADQLNPLQRQSTADFSALEELNLEGNLLTSMNVSSLFDQLIYMKSLKTLNLSYNLLNRVQSEWFKFANRNLQRLLLTGNKINHLDLGAFALNQVNELTHLRLDYNLLKELKRKTFESMPRIKELNLAHNLLHTINSETFHQLNSLQVLKLNNNKLTSWKCEYFSYLCNSISGQINVDLATLISPHQANGPANGQHQQVQPVSCLLELDLSHNSLSQLRANSISVHTKLTKLDLSHNKLSFLPPDLFRATTISSSSSSALATSSGRQLHLVSSIKYLNLAHNRLQTIDNINFKPMKNLLALDLSYNELQSLGVDVVKSEQTNGASSRQSLDATRLVVSNNLTSLLMDDDNLNVPTSEQDQQQVPQQQFGGATRAGRSLYSTTTTWPALSKLRHLNLAHNTISMINQSLLSELSPFVSLKLDLSHNYLDSGSVPIGFFSKIASSSSSSSSSHQQTAKSAPQNASSSLHDPPQTSYDLVFTLKLESLDLSHNRLGEWPASLLDNHHASLESCNLAHNRIQHLPRGSNSMIQIKSLSLEFNPLSRDASELLLSEQRSSRHLNLAATRLHAIQQATAESLQYSQAQSQLLIAGTSSSDKTSQAARLLVNQTSQLDLIRSISWPIEAPYLKHLNLSSNQLVWLAGNVFERMHSLQTLDLSNNQLTRLHLLSNQLTQVSGSLESLNLNSNLFTSIDATDFNQLSRLRHLDLGNLLSLQKLDCRFLSRVTTLRRLKMFNYPQLRNRMNALISSLQSSKHHSDRYQLKLLDELLMSTMGGHCFHLEPSGLTANSKAQSVWFKIEELELELFNNFSDLQRRSGSEQSSKLLEGFQLTDELHQLLGPQTRSLTLVGLNLTQLSDDSLLGSTSERLDLKISYTSLSHLPLRQILTSLTKKTRLRLDLRNNNIQTIDMEALQWLDELHQMNQASFNNEQSRLDSLNSASVHYHLQEPSLKLASNPFRCDCRTRPLWLWLNQRWDHLVEVPQVSDEQLGDTSTGNSANYWLKFHTVSQTSDLKCFYPTKLRGKMAQHVYYNDLVCKGTSATISRVAPSASKKQRNDTNQAMGTRDSYYLTSSSESSSPLEPQEDTDLEEDYQDLDAQGEVRVTRFNRYPSTISNSTTAYFLANFPTVPFVPDGHLKKELYPNSDAGGQEPSQGDSILPGRIGKRNQGSEINGPHHDGQPQVNTKYSKHKPNTQQRHSHYSTMTNLNSAKFGRSPGKSVELAGSTGDHAENSKQINLKHHALLTESDVLILTVASIAMALMTFIIMTVCLFKYRLDRSSSFDQEQILSTHSKMVMSRALFTTATTPGNSGGANSSGQSNGGDNSGGSSKQSSSRSKTKGTKRTANSGKSHTSDKFLQAAISKHYLQQTHPHVLASTSFSHRHQYPPMVASSHPTATGLFTPVARNFLMRSPTIRRMQGLAGNASDWFKYTLRAYPSSRGSRRRRLFIQSSAVCGGGPSQLTTAKLKTATLQPVTSENQLQSRHERLLAHSLNSLKLSGCPLHAFKCLEDGSRQDECLHCASLWATFQTRDSSRKSFGNEKEDIKKKTRVTKTKGQSSSSSSRSSSDAATVKIQPKPTSNFQQTIADKQQGGGSFMPPKMIQALAQQLDQEQANQQQVSKPPLLSGRPSNSRPMKTFGNNQQASTNSHQTDSASDWQAKVASQIPTIDVDGRFAYQSDGGCGERQLAASDMTREGSYQQQRNSMTSGELSRFDYESRPSTQSGGRATPASTVATNQEDIFILVRDTPTSETTTTTGATRYDDARSQMTTSTTNTIHNEQTMSNQDQDQCSRTSSPIAYGFMRSSPSATTLSSTPNPSQHASQYVVNRSPPPVSSLEGSPLGHYSSRKSAIQSRPHSLAGSEQRFQQYSSNSSFKGKTACNRPSIRTAPDPTIDSNNNNDDNNSSGGGYVNAILKQFQSIGQKQGSAAAANMASWTNVTPRPQQSASKTIRQQEDHEDQMIISRL